MGKLDAKKDIRRQAPRLSPKGGFSSRGSVRFLCAPFRFVVNLLEKSILSISPATEENSTDSTEVADHIRTLGMESSNMDPEVVEIVGNTLEMSHLNVQDAMVPRNQVQVLDDHDSLEKNMEIARTCGHTRLPLCIGIWIIAWASFTSNMHSDS